MQSLTSTREVLAEAADVIPGGYNSNQRGIDPPIAIRRAQGAYFEDVEGRRYLDYHAAFGPMVLGHCYPEVVDAVASALRETDLYGVGTTEMEVALAHKIVHHVPSVDEVLLCNSGSEATYHGERDALSAGMAGEVVDNTLVCRFNDLGDVEQTLRANPDQVAGIIVEPIPHNVGTLLPEPGFLEGLRAQCDREGIVLIFDEVITGFRHHVGGYQTICGVTPDLTTMGKAMANGFPMAAIGGKRSLMDRFNSKPGGDVFFAGTYNGHAAGVVAALATIELLETGKVQEHTGRLGDRLRGGLQDIGNRAGIPALATGFGSIFVLYFMDGPARSYDDLLRNDADLFVRYRQELIKRGVFELPVNLKRSHVSYSHTDQDVDRTLQAAEESLTAALDR
jgi:glutamate-1-semialdehyde 2,1-aminomutase